MHDFLGSGMGIVSVFIALVFLYFTIKWAVKNGIKEYYEEKEQKAQLEAQPEEYDREQQENQ